MKTENFPPRVYKHVETWVIRYDENKQNKFRGAIVTEFLSLEEHESIVEKLNKQIELLEGALEDAQEELAVASSNINRVMYVDAEKTVCAHGNEPMDCKLCGGVK